MRYETTIVPVYDNARGRGAAAAKANYSTLLMDDAHVALSSAGETRRSPRRAASLDAVLKEALPTFKAANQPFIIIYRLSEPEETAHASIASLSSTVGPYGHRKPDAMLRAADQALSTLEAALRSHGLYETTNIIVAAEHGRSTALKHSQTSLSLGITYPTGMSGALPPGFLAVDLMHALQAEDSTLSLFDPDTGNRRLDWAAGQYPIKANGIIAIDPAHPLVEIESRGGHDLIYFSEHLSRRESSRLGQIILETLLEQDYVSGCSQPTACSATIADSPFGEGQLVRGVFSRADTWNFMAARGPDFRSAVTSRVPASNADVARTIVELLRLEVNGAQRHSGRVLLDALRGYERGGVPTIRRQVIASTPSTDGMITEVHLQLVGSMKYFDAAGFPGLMVGVPARSEAFEAPRGWRWRFPKVRSLRIEISPD